MGRLPDTESDNPEAVLAHQMDPQQIVKLFKVRSGCFAYLCAG